MFTNSRPTLHIGPGSPIFPQPHLDYPLFPTSPFTPGTMYREGPVLLRRGAFVVDSP